MQLKAKRLPHRLASREEIRRTIGKPNNDNNNRRVIFKNRYKKTEKQPDYVGKVNIEGTDFQLAGWIRQGLEVNTSA